MIKNIILALCAASLLWIGTANATSISNGDFESGVLGNWKTRGDVELTNAGPFSAAQGMDGYYALLGHDAASTTNKIWQTFDVSGLNTVEVSFDWVFAFQDAETGARDVFFSILQDFDGSAANNITLDKMISRGNQKNPKDKVLFGTYSEIIDVSLFNTANARLQIRLAENLGDIYSFAGIDNVNVAPVPEPATMMLFGIGLAGLVAVGRRNSKK